MVLGPGAHRVPTGLIGPVLELEHGAPRLRDAVEALDLRAAREDLLGGAAAVAADVGLEIGPDEGSPLGEGLDHHGKLLVRHRHLSLLSWLLWLFVDV